MQRLRQERQQQLPRRRLVQRRLESRVGLAVDRMDAEDVSFRLQRSPQHVGPFAGRAGDDQELDGRVRQDLFEVDRPHRFEAATTQEIVTRIGSPVDAEPMPAVDEAHR